jgi:hypothetical protein
VTKVSEILPFLMISFGLGRNFYSFLGAIFFSKTLPKIRLKMLEL